MGERAQGGQVAPKTRPLLETVNVCGHFLTGLLAGEARREPQSKTGLVPAANVFERLPPPRPSSIRSFRQPCSSTDNGAAYQGQHLFGDGTSRLAPPRDQVYRVHWRSTRGPPLIPGVLRRRGEVQMIDCCCRWKLSLPHAPCRRERSQGGPQPQTEKYDSSRCERWGGGHFWPLLSRPLRSGTVRRFDFERRDQNPGMRRGGQKEVISW